MFGPDAGVDHANNHTLAFGARETAGIGPVPDAGHAQRMFGDVSVVAWRHWLR